MRRAALLLAVLGAMPAPAAERYDAPLAQLTPFLGARGGSGTGDSILGGVGLCVGWRWAALRAGVVGRVVTAGTFASWAGDVGGFVSGDLFSLWLDPALSLAAFARLDLLARLVGRGAGFVPMGAIGLRLAGVEVAFAGGPELGLRLAPGTDQGGTFEFRLGVEFGEVARFLAHLRDQSLPQPE